MSRNFRNLWREKKGATAVEFALVVPLLIVAMLGAMNIGIYLYFQNSVSTAVDEAARSATIFPTPNDSQIEANFENSLLTSASFGSADIAISHGTSSTGRDYIDLVATGSYDINLVFVDLGSIPVRVERRTFTSS